MKYCTQCGAQQIDATRVCAACGNRFAILIPGKEEAATATPMAAAAQEAPQAVATAPGAVLTVANLDAAAETPPPVANPYAGDAFLPQEPQAATALPHATYSRIGGWLLVASVAASIGAAFSLWAAIVDLGESRRIMSSAFSSFFGFSHYDFHALYAGAAIFFGQILVMLAVVFQLASILLLLRRKPFFLRYAQIGYTLGAVVRAAVVAAICTFAAGHVDDGMTFRALSQAACALLGAFSLPAYYRSAVRVRVFMGSDGYLAKAFFTRSWRPANGASDAAAAQGEDASSGLRPTNLGLNHARTALMLGLLSIVLYRVMVFNFILGFAAIWQARRAQRQGHPALTGLITGIGGLLLSVILVINMDIRWDVYDAFGDTAFVFLPWVCIIAYGIALLVMASKSKDKIGSLFWPICIAILVAAYFALRGYSAFFTVLTWGSLSFSERLHYALVPMSVQAAFGIALYRTMDNREGKHAIRALVLLTCLLTGYIFMSFEGWHIFGPSWPPY